MATNMTKSLITKNCTVTLHFSLALEDGSIIDSNFDNAPATFTMGDGSLLSGFEKVLIGLRVDQRQEFLMSPEQGFGQYNPSNIQTQKRKEFDDDMTLSVGLVVSFADAARAELPGVITGINGDEIIVDFNHPLAGKSVIFDVHILNVNDVATSDGKTHAEKPGQEPL